MPALTNSQYRRPGLFFSGHLETIYPALYRRVKNVPPGTVQRIDTPDGDFLDIYWRKQKSRKIVIIQHGLEGSADRPYVIGMAKCFFESGFDTLTWNFRGCGEEMNNTARFYHSGATADLDLVVLEAIPHYDEIYLVGFSLGGNMTLKYVGERETDPKIKRAVAISAPLDLDAGVNELHSAKGYIYEKRFVRNLKKKALLKHREMPNQIDISQLNLVKTLRDFDEYFTAPLHGFKDAADYYRQCSSRFFLDQIQIPTLILNAINDPILSKESFDHRLTESLSKVTLETTNHGGHVGFIQTGKPYYWSEERALNFCQES